MAIRHQNKLCKRIDEKGVAQRRWRPPPISRACGRFYAPFPLLPRRERSQIREDCSPVIDLCDVRASILTYSTIAEIVMLNRNAVLEIRGIQAIVVPNWTFILFYFTLCMKFLFIPPFPLFHFDVEVFLKVMKVFMCICTSEKYKLFIKNYN